MTIKFFRLMSWVSFGFWDSMGSSAIGVVSVLRACVLRSYWPCPLPRCLRGVHPCRKCCHLCRLEPHDCAVSVKCLQLESHFRVFVILGFLRIQVLLVVVRGQ